MVGVIEKVEWVDEGELESRKMQQSSLSGAIGHRKEEKEETEVRH